MKKSITEVNARRLTPKGFGSDARELYEMGFVDGAKWLKRCLRRDSRSKKKHPLCTDAMLIKGMERVLRGVR